MPQECMRLVSWMPCCELSCRIRVNKEVHLAWSSKLHKTMQKYRESVRCFFNLVLMDPLFHVKVSTARVIPCVTFTVLFVPLAK